MEFFTEIQKRENIVKTENISESKYYVIFSFVKIHVYLKNAEQYSAGFDDISV